MAEALHSVADPLAASLQLGPEAPATAVVAALTEALRLPEVEGPMPAWLRPEQLGPARRLAWAAGRYGAALLADPVGTGKSYVGLAAATRWSAGTVIAIGAPAALVPQWTRLIGSLGIRAAPVSHEALSRGHLPPAAARILLLDESHHFRHPGIRRYRNLACWLVGRRVILLSATPVVNRLDDLAHQLLLGLRDDALADAGLPSLGAALAAGRWSAPLDRVVFRRPPPADRPAVRHRSLTPLPADRDEPVSAAIESLALSSDPPVAALLRLGLLRALASSPAALQRMLDRYASLLAHARDARAAGRRFSRRELRLLTAGEPDQLQLWSLLPAPPAPTDLRLADRRTLARLKRQVRTQLALPDPRVEAVRAVLGDGRPTLVFSAHVATVHYLRRQLEEIQPAWVTGADAGVGRTRLPRGVVLAACAPDGDAAPPSPRVLLATDVAAEGLDLQRLTRVVHYDLPWTSIRLAQREGRSARLGGRSAAVDVITLRPPPALEARLHQLERLLRKTAVVRLAGMDEHAIDHPDWRSALPDAAMTPARGALCQVRGRRAGWLIGLALGDAGPIELTWWPDGGRPRPFRRRAGEVLRSASQADALPIDGSLRVAAAAALAALLRERWSPQLPLPTADAFAARQLGRRLLALAREMGRSRRLDALRLIEAGLAWLRGGHTAGEELLIASLLSLDGPALLQRLGALPARVAHPDAAPRIAGIVRVTTLSSWQTSAPCSSTSTAP